MEGRRRALEIIAAVGLVVGGALGCGPDRPNFKDTGGGGGSDTGPTADAGDTAGDAAGDTGVENDGGSDGPDGYEGEVDSPLEDSKQIRNLSEDQQHEVCRAGFDFVTNNISLDDVCLWAAHVQSASPDYENDQKAVEACESARKQWEENRDPNFDPCEGIKGAKDCTATVDQWEQCERELSVQFFDYLETLPVCSETTVDFYKNDYERYPPPSRTVDDVPRPCKPLRGSCPEFFKKWVGPVKNP